jgi:hypothetical protein
VVKFPRGVAFRGEARGVFRRLQRRSIARNVGLDVLLRIIQVVRIFTHKLNRKILMRKKWRVLFGQLRPTRRGWNMLETGIM